MLCNFPADSKVCKANFANARNEVPCREQFFVIYGEIKPFVLNIFSQENFVFLLSKIANAILRFTGKKLVFLLSKNCQSNFWMEEIFLNTEHYNVNGENNG